MFYPYYSIIMTKQDDLREQLKTYLYDRNMKIKRASVFLGLSIGTISKFINGKQSLNQRNEYRVRKLISG